MVKPVKMVITPLSPYKGDHTLIVSNGDRATLVKNKSTKVKFVQNAVARPIGITNRFFKHS